MSRTIDLIDFEISQIKKANHDWMTNVLIMNLIRELTTEKNQLGFAIVSALKRGVDSLTINRVFMDRDLEAIRTFPELNVWIQQHIHRTLNVNVTIPSDISRAYESYISTAKSLMLSQVMQELRNEIVQFYTQKVEDEFTCKHFYAIAAPSGSGKTQVAFTLAEYKSLDVVHICLVSERNVQSVYQHPSIHTVSEILSFALTADNSGSPEARERTTQSLLSDSRKLRTVAVLSRVFQLLDSDGMPFETAFELRAAINTLSGDARCPVLVVTEAFQKQLIDDDTDQFKRRSVFLRAILRASGIASIFTGTTAAMVTCIGSYGMMSSGNPNAKPWARLITQLPPLVLPSHSPTQLDLSLALLFPKANPRYMLYLREMMTEVGTNDTKSNMVLDNWLAVAARRLYSDKPTLRTEEGLLAQVLYQLNSNVIENSSTFVSIHFARYTKDYDLELLAHCVVKSGTREYFSKVAPVFPSAVEDPLLSLLLVGPCMPDLRRDKTNCHPPSFQLCFEKDKDVVLTSAIAVIFCFDKIDTSSLFSNPYARQRDYTVIEAIAAIAVINASRAGGMEGLKASDFILYFVRELQECARALQWEKSDELSLYWESADTLKVPVLLRVGDDCGELLKQFGLTVGVVKRQYDQNGGVDLAVCLDGKLICRIESENCDSGIDLHAMSDIAERHLGDDAPLTIVLVSRKANVHSELRAAEMVDTHSVWISVDKTSDLVKVTPLGEPKHDDHDVLTVRKKSRLLCFIECNETQIRKKLFSDSSKKQSAARRKPKQPWKRQ